MELDESIDDTRVMLLDAMATMADRTGRQDTFRIHVGEVSKVLLPRLREGDGHAFEVIGRGLLRCGIELPFKTPVYATLAGLLTSSTDGFCKDMASQLADAVAKELSQRLRDGHAATARRALRYLACLANASVVSPLSVAEYIHALLDAAHFELTSANRSEYGVHCRGQFLADVALSALPWIASMLVDRAPEEMNKIDALVTLVIAAWRPNSWRCVAPSINRRCVENFSDLCEAISELRDMNWKCDLEAIPKPYNSFELELSSGQEVTLSKLIIPGHSKVTFYSAPRFRLVLVNPRTLQKGSAPNANGPLVGDTAGLDMMEDRGTNQETQEAARNDLKGDFTDLTTPSLLKQSSGIVSEIDNGPPADGMDISSPDGNATSAPTNNSTSAQNGATNVESPPTNSAIGVSVRTPLVNYVIRCYVTDIVDNFSSRHLMAAERLLNLPMLKDVNDEIVESLFSQMCALPSSTFSPVYYGTLFADLCRVKDSRLPAKLLVAVQSMFQHADEFDPEAFDRLADWFSFHLSNFGYKWNWQEWSVYADADMVDKFPYRALFCKDVIARCVRLSYYDRIKNILPAEMRVFLPSEPNDGERSRFENSINDELMKIVTGKGRLTWPEVRERLTHLIPSQQISADDVEQAKLAEDDGNLQRLSALIRAILQAGCRTLSHFDIVVERYMDLLRQLSLNGGQPARRLITTEVNCFWSSVHIRRLYVLDKLAQYKVIDHMAIFDSCLEVDRVDVDLQIQPFTDHELKLRLAQSSWWEIIRLTMSRARAREEGSRKELALASQAAAAANEGELEEAEKRLERAKHTTEEAKREIRELLLGGLRRLFDISGRLLDSSVDDINIDENDNSEMIAGDGERTRLPGFHGKPIWYWRSMGMMREMARMHPQHLAHVISDLDAYTKELREKHSVLWDSFEIIREIEKCSLHTTVW